MRQVTTQTNEPAPVRTKMAIPILLYHCVDDDPPSWLSEYSVSVRDFSLQMDLIVDLGRTPLTVSQMLDALETNQLPRHPVVVSFDDGYLDFFTNAMPILTSREIAATLYVTTGALVDSPDPSPLAIPAADFLSWASLGELDQAGIELGPHSHTHPELDAIAYSDAAYEIEHSTELLAEALGRFPSTFAYPHGYASRRVRQHVAAIGLESACGVHEAFSHRDDDRFNLARLTVRKTTSFATIYSWISGRGAKLARRHELPTTTAWRMYRRLTRP